MSFRLSRFVTLIGLLFAGCATSPNTAALRVGMTKTEAIAAMGTPSSVAAQSGFEYLNYMLSESTANGYGITRPYYVRLVDGRVQAFGFSDQINRTLPPAAANARSRSDALRIGMTKDEAVAVMGQPTSVSARDNFQYLNYSVSETSPTGMSTMMRPYYVRLADGRVEAFGFSDQIGRPGPAPVPASMSANVAPSRSVSADSLIIAGIEPATLIPGQRQPVSIKVRYNLQSRPRALVDVLFNTVDVTRYRRVPGGEQAIAKGSGEVVLNVAITPVNWGANGEFKLVVHLLDDPRVPGQQPITFAQQAIPLGK